MGTTALNRDQGLDAKHQLSLTSGTRGQTDSWFDTCEEKIEGRRLSL
jgi:hypothetical protein